MIIEGLVGQEKNYVIIACNTASTSLDDALPIVREFILQQVQRPDHSIYPPTGIKMLRLKDLAERISRNGDYLKQHVFGIIKPTVKSASNTIRELLRKQNTVSVRIDSTLGTVRSKAYIMQMGDDLCQKKDFPYYENEERLYRLVSCNETATFPDQAISNLRLTFVHRDEPEDKKTVLIQNRGNQAWVPAIEANEEGRFKELAEQSQQAAIETSCYGDYCSEDDTRFHIAFTKEFNRVPDLTMLCCTHFPAMRETLSTMYLEEDDASKPLFLQQDEVARAMAISIASGGFVDPRFEELMKGMDQSSPCLRVTLGDSSLTPEQLDQSKAILQTVFKRTQ